MTRNGGGWCSHFRDLSRSTTLYFVNIQVSKNSCRSSRTYICIHTIAPVDRLIPLASGSILRYPSQFIPICRSYACKSSQDDIDHASHRAHCTQRSATTRYPDPIYFPYGRSKHEFLGFPSLLQIQIRTRKACFPL